MFIVYNFFNHKLRSLDYDLSGEKQTKGVELISKTDIHLLEISTSSSVIWSQNLCVIYIFCFILTNICIYEKQDKTWDQYNENFTLY